MSKVFSEAATISLVAEFHELFKQPILLEPQIPSEERMALRISLISEELRELHIAVLNKDIVEVADALADLQYVLTGTVLEFGLGEKFASLFSEVHRSNMSKACATQEEANATIEHYYHKDNTIAYAVKDGDKWLVRRAVDDKTLKSVNYSPADLKKILV